MSSLSSECVPGTERDTLSNLASGKHDHYLVGLVFKTYYVTTDYTLRETDPCRVYWLVRIGSAGGSGGFRTTERGGP